MILGTVMVEIKVGGWGMMLKGLGGKEKDIEPRHRQDLDLLERRAFHI